MTERETNERGDFYNRGGEIPTPVGSPEALDSAPTQSYSPEAGPEPDLEGPLSAKEGGSLSMSEATITKPQVTAVAGLEHLAKPRPSRNVHGAASRDAITDGCAVLYLRVSTTRQMNTGADIDEDGNSIATQREWATSKANKLKAPIIEEFVEPGQSAQTISKRPIFRQMLEYLDEHPEVRYVIIYMRSRVFRNFTDAAITKRALLEKGVRLISAKEEFGEGYMADAMEAITDIMNEVQVRMSGEDIKIKMRHKVEQGGTVGMAKLGYLNVPKLHEGRRMNTVEIDPERGPLIQRAFELYATGEYTVRELQEELTEQGLTTRPTVRYAAKPISHSRLAALLSDPYYVGVIRYKGELYPGRHEPLISKDLFLKVQDILRERVHNTSRERVNHHFLKGLLYCDRCEKAGRNSRLIFTRARGKAGELYDYYLCRGRQQGFCDLPHLAVSQVEDAIMRAVGAQRLDPEFAQVLDDEIGLALAIGQEGDRARREHLQREIKKLTVKEEQLFDLAADERLRSQNLKDRLLKISLERGRLEEQLEMTEATAARGAAALRSTVDLLKVPSGYYRAADSTMRRQLIETFFDRLFIDTDYEVRATGSEQPAVREIHHAEAAFRAGEKPVARTSESPRPKTGVILESTVTQTLAVLLLTGCSSKKQLVRKGGVEPPRPKAQEPKSCVSAGFTTPACPPIVTGQSNAPRIGRR